MPASVILKNLMNAKVLQIPTFRKVFNSRSLCALCH